MVEKIGEVSPVRNRYMDPSDAINAYTAANSRVSKNVDDTKFLTYLRPFGIGTGETYGWGEGNQKFGFENCSWHVDKGGYSVPDIPKFELIC